MQVATILNKKFSPRKLIMIGAAVGIPLVLAGIIAAFFLIQGTISRADNEIPQSVNAQVQAADSATIVFETQNEVIPLISYGTSPTALTKFAPGSPGTSHTIPLLNLEPDTTYYFSIEINQETYDNNGSPWTFTTGPATEGDTTTSEDLPPIDVNQTETPTPSPDTTITTVPTLSVTASPSASITPTISGSPTPTATISATMTPVPANVCKSNNCVSIIGYLGTQCSTQDYLRCIQNVNITITQQPPTNTPTPTPISAALRSSCGIDYVQSNSCTSIIWDDMSVKPQACADAFTQYFVQCKSTSWESSDPATWYCNEVVTSNQLSLPCATAPTPPPGQSIFCRVRAEGELGGDENATDWVYTQTSCANIADTADYCSIDYIQANTCSSWIWDFDYQKDPRCAPSFDHYFFQCTDDGEFDSGSFWYCNQTLSTHYTSLPCDNVGVPGDGMPITCRVRAEDGYGVGSHASAWTSASTVCPTSTPTPSPTPVL